MAKILVVEDEYNIRLLITSILRKLKHQVREAEHPPAALEILKNFSPDLILTDMKMPYMNGVEFIHEVSKLFPDVPIAVISAYSDRVPDRMQHDIEFQLTKPFSQQQLVREVHQVVPPAL
jgi:two-component SAPR family response regulator